MDKKFSPVTLFVKSNLKYIIAGLMMAFVIVESDNVWAGGDIKHDNKGHPPKNAKIMAAQQTFSRIKNNLQKPTAQEIKEIRVNSLDSVNVSSSFSLKNNVIYFYRYLPCDTADYELAGKLDTFNMALQKNKMRLERHEKHHVSNAKILFQYLDGGILSIPQIYMLMVHDEISANLAGYCDTKSQMIDMVKNKNEILFAGLLNGLDYTKIVAESGYMAKALRAEDFNSKYLEIFRNGTKIYMDYVAVSGGKQTEKTNFYRNNTGLFNKILNEMYTFVTNDGDTIRLLADSDIKSVLKENKYNLSSQYILNLESILAGFFKNHNIARKDILSIPKAKQDLRFSALMGRMETETTFIPNLIFPYSASRWAGFCH